MDLSLPLLVAQMIISLVIVVGLMLLMARYVNRRTGGVLGASARRARVRVVGRTNVGQRSSVQVVEVADRLLVVGVTDGGVTLLTELGEDEVAALDAEQAAELRAQEEAAAASPMHRWMSQLTARKTSPSGEVTAAAGEQRRHVFESVLALRKRRGERP